MPKYKLSNNQTKTKFEVENIFVDEYMKNAQPVYVLIYLYGLRLCHDSLKMVSNLQIAKELKILESDVVNAWNYWASVNLVHITNRKSETEFDIEFVDLSNVQPNPSQTVVPHTYSPIELEMYIKQDKKVKVLFDFAQEKLGKMLTPGDLSTLYSFYDFYHLPFEVIFMLIEYYVSQGKKSLRYIEKVAMSWNEKGINTVEKVEDHLCGDKKCKDTKKETAKPMLSKNKFINFQQRDIDYNQLAKQMLEQRLKNESDGE